MSSKTFFPHATLDDLELKIVSLRLDGKEHSVGDGRIVKLVGESWTSLVVELELGGAAALDTVLAPSERSKPPVRRVVAVSCTDTRTYFVEDALETSSGFRMPLVFERQAIRGSIDLHPNILRTSHRSEGGGWAFEEGAIVGRGDPVTIIVDEQDTLLGGVLKGTWEDFAESQALPALRAFSRATHFVSLVDPPVLYLNSGIPGLQALLSSKKNTGGEAALRDVVFDGISGAVWLTLTVGAAAACVQVEGERLSPSNEWSRKVLEYVAPRMTGNPDVTEAINAMVKELRDEDAAGSILSRIEAHFQQRDEFGAHLEKLFSAMRKED